MKADNIESVPLTDVKNRHQQDEKPKKRTFRSESPQPLRPFRHKPYKTIFLTFFLLFSGILFVTVGYEQTEEKGIGETYPQIFLGVLLLIPGVYHSVIIIGIWIGLNGFNYQMLPQV